MNCTLETEAKCTSQHTAGVISLQEAEGTALLGVTYLVWPWGTISPQSSIPEVYSLSSSKYWNWPLDWMNKVVRINYTPSRWCRQNRSFEETQPYLLSTDLSVIHSIKWFYILAVAAQLNSARTTSVLSLLISGHLVCFHKQRATYVHSIWMTQSVGSANSKKSLSALMIS